MPYNNVSEFQYLWTGKWPTDSRNKFSIKFSQSGMAFENARQVLVRIFRKYKIPSENMIFDFSVQVCEPTCNSFVLFDIPFDFASTLGTPDRLWASTLSWLVWGHFVSYWHKRHTADNCDVTLVLGVLFHSADAKLTKQTLLATNTHYSCLSPILLLRIRKKTWLVRNDRDSIWKCGGKKLKVGIFHMASVASFLATLSPASA